MTYHKQESTNVVKKFHENSKFSYQYYSYGALELFNDGVSICFMQGEEAEELHDQLENCQEEWEKSVIIEPYA